MKFTPTLLGSVAVLSLLLAACGTDTSTDVGLKALPGNASACFYEHADFEGRSFCASDSSERIDSQFNDLISSVRAAPGSQVGLYEHSSYGGSSVTLSDDAKQIPSGINDLVSSFKIQAALPNNAKACFYSNADYQGDSFCADESSGTIDPEFNDLISSVRVAPGSQVTLYDDSNYGGSSATLSDSAGRIPSSVNDLVSSFKIQVGGETAPKPDPNKRNPFVEGYYADPDIDVYEGQYWVFPTTSLDGPEQTYLDAFSSPDLVNWTKHANVLTTENFSWAETQVWAPAPIERNGKYYLYFAANDIQSDAELGGIGVGVADQPQGPYKDAIGKPLIGEFHNGAQPIDQDVWIDDDGQAYMYYGGHGHANVAKLNEDMISFDTFDDGSTFKEITPEGYVEGAQMFKRNGTYYLMWSEGYWGASDYSVAYAMADSPLGPFERLDKILQQDESVARGAGHNSVLNIPGTDTWYIFYHRRPLDQTGRDSRVLAFDRMYFNADGTIQRVVLDGPE